MITALSVTKETEFWLAVVKILGALYKVKFLSVCSTEDRSKGIPDGTRRYVDNFTVRFPIKAPY